MGSIGSFTAAIEEASSEPTTFTLEGETFALQPTLSASAFLQFSRLAGEIDLSDTTQVEAINMVVMFDLLRDAIVPEHWERFERVVKEKRVGIPTIMVLSSAIMEQATGRPTERPSDLDGRPSGTSRTSNGKRSRSSAGTAPAGMRAVKKGDDQLLNQIFSGQVSTLPEADPGTG
jgi:hypothetical protein